MRPQNKNKRINTFLDHAYSLNYRERPVSMKEFLTNERYFGKLTGGGKTIFPIWTKTLDDLSKEDSKYLVVLTGAIGTGKTRAAIWGLGYIMYRILCLKDPWKFFGRAAGGKMAIVFFNLTKTLGSSVGYNLLMTHLLASPWFCEKGIIQNAKGLNPRIEFPLFEFKLGSPYAKGFGTVGSSVIAAIMDEVDDPNESEKQRQRVLQAYESTVRRFISRFVRDGESLGKFFLVASKQEQHSFLNAFIAEMKDHPAIHIVDIPVWEAHADSDYCGDKFPVKMGDLYVTSEVLACKDDSGKVIFDNEAVLAAQRAGFKVIWVPVEYYSDFIRDVIGSLRDIAGISVDYLRKNKLFSSEKSIVNCYDSTLENPITKLTIEVGMQDDIDFARFINFNAIKTPRSVPRYLHVDISFSGNGDGLGIGMSCVKGWQRDSIEDEEGNFIEIRKPVVHTDFGMRIHGKKNDKIPLNKVRKLIIDLKKVYGFNLVLCTFDHRSMSEDSIQILTRAGITCDYLSCDKDSSLYHNFRDLVEDERWSTPRNEFMHFELSNLEEDLEKNKIDHPEKVLDIEFMKDGNTREVVLIGSKDIADGVCGSVNSALNNCATPPDIEVMKKAFKDSVTQKSTDKNKLWWVDESSLRARPKKEVDEQTNKDAKTFKDIFKKAQGDRDDGK
jgi:hypothetical protein